MTYSTDQSKKEDMQMSRILSGEIFLYLLDLEVKRARRYQNFFCILILKLNQVNGKDDKESLETCYQRLTHLLSDEFRDSDIIGSLKKNRLATLLPYADLAAGNHARDRFEGSLKYFDFKTEGYEVSIDQVCFPMDGADTADLVRKVVGPESI